MKRKNVAICRVAVGVFLLAAIVAVIFFFAERPPTASETDEKTEHHHFYRATVVQPTCEQDGYSEYSCDCGSVYRAEITQAKGHSSSRKEGTPATCTACGRTDKIFCAVCLKTLTEEEELSPLGHSLKISETQATCFSAGRRTSVCERCGERTEEKIPPLEHSFRKYAETAATCGKNGKIVFSCERCGAQKTQTIPAREHEFSTVKVPVGPTGGGVKKVCSLCGYSYWESFSDPPDPEEKLPERTEPQRENTDGQTELPPVDLKEENGNFSDTQPDPE